ncbi:MAG: biotin transporter BioY [Candidatus Sericytochromatia bacterium]|nr:biotin transporter BioY [Candidatus Sericytochromatia bacterium]
MRLIQVLFLTTLLSCSAFVALKIPFLTFGPPRQLPSADVLYDFHGLMFGSHIVTAQLLMVWLTAAWLGPRRGALAIAFYLSLGLGGLAVFSGGGGSGYIYSPTFGYLLAFLPAVILAGRFSSSIYFGKIWIGFFYAWAVIQCVGFTYQAIVEGVFTSLLAWREFAASQVLQFLPGQLALMTVAAFAISMWRKGVLWWTNSEPTDPVEREQSGLAELSDGVWR